jgi:hypothetical protein
MSSNRNLGKVLNQLKISGGGVFVWKKQNRTLPCAGRCSQSLGPGGWPGVGWTVGRTVGLSVNGQLVFQVVKDVVRWGGQWSCVGEDKVGGDEEVGQVIGGDVASDRLGVASRASVLENAQFCYLAGRSKYRAQVCRLRIASGQ